PAVVRVAVVGIGMLAPVDRRVAALELYTVRERVRVALYWRRFRAAVVDRGVEVAGLGAVRGRHDVVVLAVNHHRNGVALALARGRHVERVAGDVLGGAGRGRRDLVAMLAAQDADEVA